MSSVVRQADCYTASSLPLIVKAGTTGYIPGPNGLPLEQVTSGGSVYYYHADQIGNTRALTDSTGAVQDTWAYDPYGNVTSSTGSVVNPFRFQGQYLDATNGLYYLRARWCDSNASQFAAVDRALPFTKERYVVVSDDPVNSTDPTGLWTVGVCANVGISIVTWFGTGALRVVVDQEGSIATTETAGTGSGLGIGASANADLQISNASTVRDLSGPFQVAGGTVGDLDTSNAEGFTGYDSQGRWVGGAEYGPGIGAGLPVEADSCSTHTKVHVVSGYGAGKDFGP